VVVASFPAPETAHSAVTKLELAGVAPNDVHMLTQPVQVSASRRQRADERTVRWFEGVLVRGLIIGAVAGALLVGVPVSLIWQGESAQADIAAALGGAVAGAFIGAFIAVGSAMPRNVHAWDTFLLEHDSEVCVAVTVDGGRDADELARVMRDAGATSVEQLRER
jgi:outer membrane lipoprotein SlyB